MGELVVVEFRDFHGVHALGRHLCVVDTEFDPTLTAEAVVLGAMQHPVFGDDPLFVAVERDVALLAGVRPGALPALAPMLVERHEFDGGFGDPVLEDLEGTPVLGDPEALIVAMQRDAGEARGTSIAHTHHVLTGIERDLLARAADVGPFVELFGEIDGYATVLRTVVDFSVDDERPGVGQLFTSGIVVARGRAVDVLAGGGPDLGQGRAPRRGAQQKHPC